MTVRHVGYSERGMINALCEDMSRDESTDRLQEFLKWCVFPCVRGGDKPKFTDVTKACLLVEQSFSDFGDADLLILLTHSNGKKDCVFVEAKVATDVATPRTIEQRFRGFEAFVAGAPGHRSNLFVQLYRKMRLAHVLTLAEQSPYEPHRLLGRQSLGQNCVVLRAAHRVSEYVREPVWYLALVPDAPDATAQFFDQHLRHFDPPTMFLDCWNGEHLGFLCWETVKRRCRGAGGKWPQTRMAFAHNQGQIFQSGERPHDVCTGWAYADQEGRDVIVVQTAAHNCRVVRDEQDDDGSFPASWLVARESLRGPGHEPQHPTRERHPQGGKEYHWVNPQDGQECHVIVEHWGWQTCRVHHAGPSADQRGTFYVNTADLKRLEEPA